MPFIYGDSSRRVHLNHFSGLPARYIYYTITVKSRRAQNLIELMLKREIEQRCPNDFRNQVRINRESSNLGLRPKVLTEKCMQCYRLASQHNEIGRAKRRVHSAQKERREKRPFMVISFGWPYSSRASKQASRQARHILQALLSSPRRQLAFRRCNEMKSSLRRPGSLLALSVC